MSISSNNNIKINKNKAQTRSKKILLIGPPNVGKSVFFSKLTNIHALSSNYTGTTVSFMEGEFFLDNSNSNCDSEQYTLVDVPGTYSLTATSIAEKVAIDFLTLSPCAIIFILNAADLIGSIKLALEIKKYNIPIVGALNLIDLAQRQGKNTNIQLLSQELGFPITPTVAIKSIGLKELKETLIDTLNKKISFEKNSKCLSCGYSYNNHNSSCSCKNKSNSNVDSTKHSQKDLWKKAQEIVARVQKSSSSKHSFLDSLGDAMIKPFPGIPLAILSIFISLFIIVGLGKLLQAHILEPLVNFYIVPFFENVIFELSLPDMLHNILIGEFGIFRIGFEWILTLVLPFVILFQLVFSFLEDSGILPRIAVLFDNIMKKLGVQGGSLITILLGFGCAVPAIIGTRALSTKKERLVISTIICFSIPCISQTGALISLLADYSFILLLAVFLTFIIVFISASVVASKLIKGKVDPLIIEIPNLLLPEPKSYFKKFYIRIKQFFLEAEGPMLVAVVIAALIAETGMLEFLSESLKPLVSMWLGLPKEASMSLILGIIRREMSVAPLLGMNLSPIQMYVGAVVSLVYMPCLSVFGILSKEFGAKFALLIILSTTATAIFLGGILNQIANLLMLIFS